MTQHSAHTAKDNASRAPATPTPQKYTVFRSLLEMSSRVQQNPATFIATLLASCLLSILATFLVTQALYSFIALVGPLPGVARLLGVWAFLVPLLVWLLFYTLLYALVYAFTVSGIAFSLSVEKNDAKTALKKAMSVTVRVALVNAWMAIVAYWPAIVAYSLMPMFLFLSPTSMVIVPVFVFAALIWSLIAYLRYSLAPYVAIFEIDVPVRQTLKRSQDLLGTSGQWFVFKGFMLLTLVIVLFAAATRSPLQQLDTSGDWVSGVAFIILAILAEGAMIMLYFNRSKKGAVANVSQSPKLLAVVVFVLVVLLIVVAGQSRSADNGSQLTDEKRKEYMMLTNNIERETEIGVVADGLEGYYKSYGYYPALADITSPSWVSKNLTYTFRGRSLPVSADALSDPNGLKANMPGSDYHYTVSPEGCTQCASFTLTSMMQEDKDYVKSSKNNSVNAVKEN